MTFDNKIILNYLIYILCIIERKMVYLEKKEKEKKSPCNQFIYYFLKKCNKIRM